VNPSCAYSPILNSGYFWVHWKFVDQFPPASLPNSSKASLLLWKSIVYNQPSMSQAEDFSDQLLNHNYTVPSHKHLQQNQKKSIRLPQKNCIRKFWAAIFQPFLILFFNCLQNNCSHKKNQTIEIGICLIEMSSPPLQLGEQFQFHHISDETFNRFSTFFLHCLVAQVFIYAICLWWTPDFFVFLLGGSNMAPPLPYKTRHPASHCE
jgi:hypothetical protein